MSEPLETVPVAPPPAAATQAPATPLEPVPAEARLAVLDALRGAALLAVLAVNLVAMGHPQATGLGAAVEAVPGGWALDVIELLFMGKGYALLALLFGFGVGVQARRAEAAGQAPGRLVRRRLLALGAIGVVHGLFGWYGDILVTYAVFGLLLLAFLKARPRTMLLWAAGLLAAATLALLALGALFQLLASLGSQGRVIEEMNRAIRTAAEADTAAALRAYGQGPYGALFARRFADAATGWAGAVGVLPEILALFLAGLAAERTGLATDPARRPLLARAALGLALVGLPVNVLHARLAGAGVVAGPGLLLLALAAYTVGAPALAAAGAAAALLLRDAAPVRGLVAWLAPLGRVSLSAYLLQTVVFTNVFYFHGLGLYGRLSFPALLGLAVAAWLAQVLLARAWLDRFRFGPAEWLVRRLAYGHRPG